MVLIPKSLSFNLKGSRNKDKVEGLIIEKDIFNVERLYGIVGRQFLHK